MKIDRLVSIITVLLERKKISASELAGMFEVSTRTIYRDIETLNMSGIPIVTSTGSNGGISILEDFKIDKNLFSTSDISVLLTALNSLKNTFSDPETLNILAKLKGLVPNGKLEEINRKTGQVVIDLTPWKEKNSVDSYLKLIKTAINKKKILKFMYEDRQRKKSNRIIEPYRLILKGIDWYVEGFCIVREDFRYFKLSRISGLTAANDTFIPRELPVSPLEESPQRERETIQTIIRAEVSVVREFTEIYGENSIISTDNNEYLLSIPFSENEYSYRFLMGFIDRCVVLEPEKVRNEVQTRLLTALSKYKEKGKKIF